jgi:hypothetical protein
VRTLNITGQPEKKIESQPLVDVNVSYERNPHPDFSKLSRAIRVFTRNHVYILDSSLHCREIRKSLHDEPLSQSQYIGARLVCGYLSRNGELEMSYPFPRPGSMAVFETVRGKSIVYHRTTVVTRVELDLSIITVPTKQGVPSWEDIMRAQGRDGE